MRILSIITLCFIIAASAYAGERSSSRKETNSEPAAVQSRARTQLGTPSTRVGPSQSNERTAPTTYAARSERAQVAAPAPRVSSYSPPSAPRASYNNSPSPAQTAQKADYGRQTSQQPNYRQNTQNTQERSPYGYRRSDTVASNPAPSRVSYTSYRPDTQAETPVRTPTTPERTSQYSSFRGQDDNGAHQPQRSDKRPDTTPREVKSQPSAQPSRSPQAVDRSSHDRSKTVSSAYSPSGTRHTVGYHTTKYVAPKSYKPPVYRQGHYYYAPAYHPRPLAFGYWAFDYSPGFSWRSVYFNFGLLPYVQINRIRQCSYTVVEYVPEPVYVSGRPYVYGSQFSGLDDALGDIRSAFLSGRFDLIERHVRPGITMAVLTDGEYDYSISSEDYLTMTRDAMSDLNTVGFVWDTVRERRDGTLTAFGQHSYQTAGKSHDVYVEYTFQKIGSGYYLVEVGSSLNPLY